MRALPRGGGTEAARRCPVCHREIPTFLYLRRGKAVGCDGCVEPVDLWEAPRPWQAEEQAEKEEIPMEELYELLESKLREIIEKKKEIEIRDIKDAAVILRELKDMEAPEEPEGARAAWWSWGPCGRSRRRGGRAGRREPAGRGRNGRGVRPLPAGQIPG